MSTFIYERIRKFRNSCYYTLSSYSELSRFYKNALERDIKITNYFVDPDDRIHNFTNKKLW